MGISDECAREECDGTVKRSMCTSDKREEPWTRREQLESCDELLWNQSGAQHCREYKCRNDRSDVCDDDRERRSCNKQHE